MLHGGGVAPSSLSAAADIGIAKTASNIDELSNMIDFITRKEKGTEVCGESEAEKMATMKIREDESNKVHSEEIPQQDQSLKKTENVSVSLQ
ncbi:hypothetical protein Y032_0683g1503 [Ancylostoma ceylanicum]|uniref:Uncharacterized protein n=1 Tax=Ancylostoma ceylanicum TaxID=53326 RepID=A0A016WI98_9BILA|nr:hypothetical protein Y032_0683g1503 [Ancylostoma ceylanicum]